MVVNEKWDTSPKVDICSHEITLNQSYSVLQGGRVIHFAVPYANLAESIHSRCAKSRTEKWVYGSLAFLRSFQIKHEKFPPSVDYLKLPFVLTMLTLFNFVRTFFLFNFCCQMITPCSVKK